ncbi:NAD(P)-dependent oxidoreductase [Derxia lacustris]|uniref:NAD(P)-dependent oxidoreductase n=1 Tax=Derxia lacustris TaxID=764842 RepID=UPI000A17651C|nr:NAD(P)-dependent oxidoreductase [Derxia lacustris]
MELGFIGLGAMGHAMATNLLKAGHRLRVWNRSPDKAADLVALGALPVATPAEAVGADAIVFTMLADDAALHAVVSGPDGFGARLGAGGIHVSMSTIAPQTAQALAALHAERGAAYVAAPVFGRPDAAAAAKLWVLSAGPAEACARVQPLLAALGQKVFPLGSDPAQAHVLKLGGNFLIMGAIEAMAEAMALGEQYGLPRQTLVDVLGASIFPSPIYLNYGAQIAAHDYRPARFKLSLGLKDANLVLYAAGKAGVAMPLAQLAQGRLAAAVAKGRGDWDWTASALGASDPA